MNVDLQRIDDIRLMRVIKSKIYRLWYGKPIVLVSGLPRSGTSMIMQMLEKGGLEVVTDKLRKADDDNPKGYYEYEPVKDLDKEGDKSWLRHQKGKVIKIISFLLNHLPLDLNYKVVFIERNLDEILASQNKMLTHRGEYGEIVSDEKMKRNYTNHLLRVKYLLNHTPNFDTLYLQHYDLLISPEEQAVRINQFLGYRLNVEAMSYVVDNGLYRNRAKG